MFCDISVINQTDLVMNDASESTATRALGRTQKIEETRRYVITKGVSIAAESNEFVQLQDYRS